MPDNPYKSPEVPPPSRPKVALRTGYYVAAMLQFFVGFMYVMITAVFLFVAYLFTIRAFATLPAAAAGAGLLGAYWLGAIAVGLAGGYLHASRFLAKARDRENRQAALHKEGGPAVRSAAEQDDANGPDSSDLSRPA